MTITISRRGEHMGVGRVVVRLLVSAVVAGICAALCGAAARAEIRAIVIGTSQRGSPLTLYELGDAAQRVLILGGQHGGPEENTVELASALLAYFESNPSEVPAGTELDVLPVSNPDGLASGSRQFASGVDPNRNWGGADW